MTVNRSHRPSNGGGGSDRFRSVPDRGGSGGSLFLKKKGPTTGNYPLPRGAEPPLEPPAGTTPATVSQQATINVRGNSKETARGAYCTPKWLADAVGPWDLDPFSNPRSHIHADAACALERDDDGFGDGAPGSYLRSGHGLAVASAASRVWIQPPYSIVLRAFRHYAHTRWCCLLRFDPRTEWFNAIYAASSLVCVPRGVFNFEPPPGVSRGGGNSFPHALYYHHAEDATPAVLRACISWRKRPT